MSGQDAPSNIGGADPKFEGDASVAPLSTNKGGGASMLNPGNVHPTSDPNTGHYPPSSEQGQKGPSILNSIENPYMLQEALNKLESSLDDIIDMFAKEGNTLSKDGDFSEGKKAIKKFQGWRDELEQIKKGQI